MSDVPSVSTHLRSELDDGLLQIVLARPDKLNALLGETLDGIATLVRWAAVQPSVRCVLLWAEGKVFSVGDDLRGMGPRMGVESDEAECIDSYPHVVAEIARLRKPVVVALHGAVYGGAMEIALACDLRVGDRTIVYGPVYAEHAFASGTSLLPMFVGVPVARRLLLLPSRSRRSRPSSWGCSTSSPSRGRRSPPPPSSPGVWPTVRRGPTG